MTVKKIPWHALGLKEIESRLKTDFKNGLSSEEAKKRLKKFGANAFEREREFYYLKLFWKQVKSPLVFILIVAGIVTLFLEEYTNSIVIFLAVFINMAIGIFQEGRASRTLDKLKSSQKKYATVLRDGRQKIIESSELVPGDVVILKMGDQVPADVRLIEEKGLEVNEAALTGEWVAVGKDALGKIGEEARISERLNMAWMGTLVTEGWAKAVVVNIGFGTEIGKIAELVSEEDKMESPLQKGIGKLARFLGITVALALAVIFTVGMARGGSFSEMLLVSVAIAVAAIPECLPVAVTVVLALGMEKILSKGGLVKNLNAVETLGSTTIILTDKTGTLTKAEMRVSKIITLLSEKKEFKEKEHKDRLQILEMAMLATGAFIENSDDELKEWIVRGSPVDKAILLASIEAGLRREEILKKYPRVDFIPFDSERRFSASIHKFSAQKNRVFALGAPETILSFCDKIYKEGRGVKMSAKDLEFMKRRYEKETAQGARILAVAYKDCEIKTFPHHGETDGAFENMVFGGFIGFHDPLREDVVSSIKSARGAMVRPVMVTGDHLITAKKIAEEAGLLSKNGLVMDGGEIENLSEEELEKIIGKVDVFARVLPHQKMDIVKAWQAKGEIVAMTGDGVNDAPALKRADISIALGSATEVAKEASDIILMNNNFGVIVAAIEEGRRILDNLRKIIAYLFSTAFSEIILVGVAIIAGLPLPILPVQILWTNIIGEGFMNFAFAFEPKENDLMKRDPKAQPAGSILSADLKKLISIITAATAVSMIALFLALLSLNYPIKETRTIVFAGLSIGSIFFAFSLKNLKKPIWKINIFSNLYLVFSLMAGVVMLAASLLLPPLQKLLSLVQPSAMEFLFILGIGFFNLAIIEIGKYFIFERKLKKA